MADFPLRLLPQRKLQGLFADSKNINFKSQLVLMTQADLQWNKIEKEVAQTALKKAYNREIKGLIQYVRETAADIQHLDDVWQLHDLLSARRHDIDGKYDDTESVLIFTLSNLVKAGLLESAELEGLAPDKRAKVNVLTRM